MKMAPMVKYNLFTLLNKLYGPGKEFINISFSYGDLRYSGALNQGIPPIKIREILIFCN